MINETVFMWILMPMVLILLIGNLMIFRILKSRHIEKYNLMGQPGVLWNHSLKSSWNMMKFLVKRKHKNLSDKRLSLLSDFILVLSLIYLFLFFVLIGQVIYNAPPQFN